MKWKATFWAMALVLVFSSLAMAETPASEGKRDIPAVIEDGEGKVIEGILRASSDELNVISKDNQKLSIPLKLIKSINVEEVKEGILGSDPREEAKRYAVHLENSQEIYTLREKYTFNLVTDLGVVTKSIDPEWLNQYLAKGTNQAAAGGRGKPFFQDKSIILRMELKF